MEFQQRIRRSLVRAALNSTTSWVIIGTTLALSIGLQDPFILFFGAAAETLAVMTMLNSKKFTGKVLGRFEEQQNREKQLKFEAIVKQSDPETRQRYFDIVQSSQEIERLSQEGDSAFLSTGLSATISQLQMLREKSANLMEKRLLIRKYLVRVDLSAMERECQKLERNVAVIQDPVAKKQFQQSLTLKRQELETYRSMFVALQRIDGQLEQISSTLSSLKGKIVLLKTSEVTTEGGYDKMGEELKALVGDVELMESSVADAAALEATALSTSRRPPQRIVH
ncbi:MAG: hypothetical protein AB1714_07680 [Acidobacteriota bacterium]